MNDSNKIMTKLLKKVFKFNCLDCKRYWSSEEILLHKRNNLCTDDVMAENTIEKLKIFAEKPKQPEEKKLD